MADGNENKEEIYSRETWTPPNMKDVEVSRNSGQILTGKPKGKNLAQVEIKSPEFEQVVANSDRQLSKDSKNTRQIPTQQPDETNVAQVEINSSELEQIEVDSEWQSFEDTNSDKETIQEEIRLVLLGKTGSGKSSVGNSIFGKIKKNDRIFRTCSRGESGTTKCECERQQVFGEDINIVDTPGVFDTREDQEIILLEIAKCIGLCVPGPHVFLLVIRLDTKFTDEEFASVTNLRKLFGTEIDEFTIIIFTHKDQLIKDEDTIEDWLKSAPSRLQNIVQKCKKRYVVFDNFAEGEDADNQTKELFEKIHEIWKDNGRKHFESEVFALVEKIYRENAGASTFATLQEWRRDLTTGKASAMALLITIIIFLRRHYL